MIEMVTASLNKTSYLFAHVLKGLKGLNPVIWCLQLYFISLQFLSESCFYTALYFRLESIKYNNPPVKCRRCFGVEPQFYISFTSHDLVPSLRGSFV